MKLKCIGGLADGRRIWVEDYMCKENEWIKVPMPVMALAIEFDPNKIPEEATVTYLIYKVTSFCFKQNDYYYFLIPENWTNKEAMLHQFGK